MRKPWAAPWSEMRTWWSLRIGAVGTLLIAGIPALHEAWPDLAPSLLSWFPHSGQQWVPFIGGLLAIVARMVSQGAVVAALKWVFSRKKKDDSNG